MKRKFRIIDRQIIFSGKVVHLEKLKVRAARNHVFQRELIKHRGASVVVPVLNDGRLVVVCQHRIATNGWLLEFPAGTLERGESPLNCAKREIVEEIGYRAKKFVKLVDFYSAPGISTEKMHVYLATNLAPAKAQLDEDEFLEVQIVTENKLHTMIQRGRIKDAKTIIGFFYYLEYCKRRNRRLP